MRRGVGLGRFEGWLDRLQSFLKGVVVVVVLDRVSG